MKTINFAAVSAALVLFSVSVGQAASKPNDNSPATQARTTLERIDSLSASMVKAADWLALTAWDSEYTAARLERLDILKDNVNKIGRELGILEAEQGSLTEWESQTVNQIMPLMKLISAYTTGAIENYSSGPDHLFATSFPAYTTNLFEDAGRVKELLDGHLKLAAVEEREQRLEGEVEASR